MRLRNPETRQWIEYVPGLPNDTFVSYGGPNFKPERKKLHKKILQQVLSDCTKDKKKQAIMTMGGPASGKSFALKSLDTSGFVHIDSDAIKGLLPEYLVAIEAHARNAASMVHDESSELAEAALATAIQRGCNLVYDGTGKNAAKYARIIDQLHDAGYSVRLIYVHVDPSVAVPRALDRAERSGRYVPDYVIQEAYASIPFNFAEIANRADAWTLFDTTETPARLVASKESHQRPQVFKPALLESFVSKYPQKAELKLNPRRNPVRNPVQIDAKAFEQALSSYLRSRSADDGDTGLS